MDNVDPGFSVIGSWSTYTSSEYPKYGPDVRYKALGVGDATATFRPEIPVAGDYEVFVWLGTWSLGATNMPHAIQHSDGSTEVPVNMRGPDYGVGSWISIGVYRFEVGTGGSVAISDDADGYVGADAVRWVQQSVGVLQPVMPTITPSNTPIPSNTPTATETPTPSLTQTPTNTATSIASETLVPNPPINGSLEQNGNQQILNLWGTNYEMGYAHGFLMADKIRDIIDTFLIGKMAQGNISGYNDFQNYQEENIVWSSQYLDEINGMQAGMLASGKNLYVQSLGRNINAEDIKTFNLTVEFDVLCSSYGVWGNASVDGNVILAKTTDYDFDSQGNAVNHQVLITYEPLNAPNFVSVSWPGMIGVIAGMNEEGVSIMVNLSLNGQKADSGPAYGSLAVFRNILENTNQANYLTQPLAIVNSLDEYSPFILQIGSPYKGIDNPVYYLDDSFGNNIIRYSDDFDPDYDHIIGTNHFLIASNPPPSGSTVDRYNRIKDGLVELYNTGDGKVDRIEALSVIDSVAEGGTEFGTLHSVTIRPNEMELDVSFATMEDGVFTKATDLTWQTYSWTSLFPNHGTASTFPDVPPDHWAWQFVEAISTAGLTSGYPDGTYRPDNLVTRAEMSVLLMKGIHGSSYTPPTPDGSSPFVDIEGHWAEAWMEELYDEGLASGYPDNTYRPENRVSRAEMAVFLLEAMHGSGYTPPAPGGGSFSDVSGHWAEARIEQLKAEGIASGYPDGTYRPENQVTRAEMAVFLVNAFSLPLP